MCNPYCVCVCVFDIGRGNLTRTDTSTGTVLRVKNFIVIRPSSPYEAGACSSHRIDDTRETFDGLSLGFQGLEVRVPAAVAALPGTLAHQSHRWLLRVVLPEQPCCNRHCCEVVCRATSRQLLRRRCRRRCKTVFTRQIRRQRSMSLSPWAAILETGSKTSLLV